MRGSTKSGCGMAGSSGKGCAPHLRSCGSGRRRTLRASVGIPSAGSPLCSLWGVTAESSVLRQASRRSWRIGQRLPVKVKYLHYAETMQESCLRLMGKKLLVSLAMEGKFSSEGLQAISDEDDILMAMARELVTEKGIGERADAVWATLQKKQEEVLETRTSEVPDAEGEPAVLEIPPSISNSTTVDQWPPLTTAMESSRRRGSRRQTSATPDGQLALF